MNVTDNNRDRLMHLFTVLNYGKSALVWKNKRTFAVQSPVWVCECVRAHVLCAGLHVADLIAEWSVRDAVLVLHHKGSPHPSVAVCWEWPGLPFNKSPVAATLRLCSELLKVAFNWMFDIYLIQVKENWRHHKLSQSFFFSLILIIILLKGL